jgi:glutamyl-tRNA(Gln) amidotransferase subunit D
MDYEGEIKKLLDKSNVEIGDTVHIISKLKEYSGILMPRHEFSSGDVVIIKLPNGYNIGLAVDPNTEIKVMERKTEEKELPKRKIRSEASKPTISILHTGGTIASKVDYRTGSVSASFSAEDILAMFPVIENISNIRSRLLMNMWSDDMRFSHYNILAQEIRVEIENAVDGIIITHGTDTLAYTSAALSFILKDLPTPVILVGAQRSSDRGSSDAGSNLISAAQFIANSDFGDVAICMHQDMDDRYCSILPACKTRKLHTSRRDAFRPINNTPWAKIGYPDGKIEFLKKNYTRRDKKRKLKMMPINENIRVGILKVHTNMYPEQFSFFEKEKFDGLIIEGTGLGHTPGHVYTEDESTKIHANIFGAIQSLVNSGCIVVMSPGTIYGRIDLNVYDKGRDLLNFGVLGNYSDMLPETAFIKLVWLLSNYPKEEVKELIGKNLRGEITDRVEKDTFLI